MPCQDSTKSSYFYELRSLSIDNTVALMKELTEHHECRKKSRFGLPGNVKKGIIKDVGLLKSGCT